ncbi:MAG: cardiolipin synthase [Bacillaceae bacterium]|nr:cardiolipin synthase [Bacillaceae bacterium]
MNHIDVVISIIAGILVLSTWIIGFLIVLENRHPSKTIAWLTVLIAFPLIGFIFYVMLGRNVRKGRLFEHKSMDRTEMETLSSIVQWKLNKGRKQLEPVLSPHMSKLRNLVSQNSRAPLTSNNAAEIYIDGDPHFEALKEALQKATHHIHMVYYILRDDEVGKDIQEILMQKARAGVRVRVLYDGVGSHKLSRKYVEDLKAAGVEVAVFLPVVFPYFNSKINYRNHRKIVVVDGKIGFVGGMNIGDEYRGLGPLGYWRDTHMKVEGEAVYQLQMIFMKDWYVATNQFIQDLTYFPEQEKIGDEQIQIVASGPDSDWEFILHTYFLMITNAKHYIYLTSPYLIPDESILTALKTAALSGVDVRLILPSYPDHKIVFWGSRSYYEELLESGVKIFEYEKGFVHAKTIIVDGEIASLGTANMDMRSFEHNFEVNAIIYQGESIATLEKNFFDDLMNCRQVYYKEIKNRSLGRRMKESGARLLSPLL